MNAYLLIGVLSVCTGSVFTLSLLLRMCQKQELHDTLGTEPCQQTQALRDRQLGKTYQSPTVYDLKKKGDENKYV